MEIKQPHSRAWQGASFLFHRCCTVLLAASQPELPAPPRTKSCGGRKQETRRPRRDATRCKAKRRPEHAALLESQGHGVCPSGYLRSPRLGPNRRCYASLSLSHRATGVIGGHGWALTAPLCNEFFHSITGDNPSVLRVTSLKLQTVNELVIRGHKCG